MRHRPRFRLHHLAPLDDTVRRTLATMLTIETPMLLTTRTAMPVSEMLMVMVVPTMNTGAGLHTMNLGDPLRGRAFRSNLRFAPISAAIPVASAPFGRCALRLPKRRHAVPNVRTPRPTLASLSSRRRFAPGCVFRSKVITESGRK